MTLLYDFVYGHGLMVRHFYQCENLKGLFSSFRLEVRGCLLSYFILPSNITSHLVYPKSSMRSDFMKSERKGDRLWASLSKDLSNVQEVMTNPVFTESDWTPTQFDSRPFVSTDMTPLPLNFVPMNHPTTFVMSDHECQLLEDFVEKVNQENFAFSYQHPVTSTIRTSDNCIMNKPHEYSQSPRSVEFYDMKQSSFADRSMQYGGDSLNSAMKISMRAAFPPITPSNDMANSSFGTPTFDEDVSDPAKPLKALSAYNFFFRYERDRLLSGNIEEETYSKDLQELLLHSHWYRDRSQKRRHRKSHGKIDFATLSRMVSQRWKKLPEDRKSFFKEVARKDLQRYRQEQKQLEYCGAVTSESFLYSSSSVPVAFSCNDF